MFSLKRADVTEASELTVWSKHFLRFIVLYGVLTCNLTMSAQLFEENDWHKMLHFKISEYIINPFTLKLCSCAQLACTHVFFAPRVHNLLPRCIFGHVNGLLRKYTTEQLGIGRWYTFFAPRMQICTGVYFGRMNTSFWQIEWFWKILLSAF